MEEGIKFAAPRTMTWGWWSVMNLRRHCVSSFLRCRSTFFDYRLRALACIQSSNSPDESNITNVVVGFPGPQQQAIILGAVSSSMPTSCSFRWYGATETLFHNCFPHSISSHFFAWDVKSTRASFSNEGRRNFEKASRSINLSCSFHRTMLFVPWKKGSKCLKLKLLKKW